MAEDKLFQFLVSRVNVRETSTLTVASITSSASVILWGLYLQLFDKYVDLEFVRVFGIILPILGYAYFETTFATQQRWDFDEINKMIKNDTEPDKYDNLKKIIGGQNKNFVLPKIIIWKILLVLPIIGWCSTFGAPYTVLSSFFLSIVIILVIHFNESAKAKAIEKF